MESLSETGLNPGQHEAVTYDEGPLFILAGAGTGKTRVITDRIVWLMREKGVKASEILALTFTEKAAEEMVLRVDAVMGLSSLRASSEEVQISTFHGFCDRLLREKGAEIGLDPGFSLMDTTQQWLFLKRNLFAFELEYYRPLGNPGKFLHVLLGHFSRLKDEDIVPEAYVRHAEGLVALSTTARAGQASSGSSTGLGSDAAAADREEAVKMLEVARAYATYQDLMVQNNGLDFGDLQFYALRLLEKRASVLRELQERYKYILVDEFQDTNFAQMKLVLQLGAAHGNVTVVGDDDQSIYKWRGASLSNIEAFQKAFPQAKTVVLTENYRSTQQVLDASYALIQGNNPERLEVKATAKAGFPTGIVKRLKAQREGAKVQVANFEHYTREADFIAAEIGRLVAGGAGGPVGYGDIAILVRANSHAEPLSAALSDAGIPFAMRDVRGLWQAEVVKDVLAFLRFLVKPHDDVSFFRLMSLPFFGVAMSELLEVVRKAKHADYKPVFYYLRDVLGGSGGHRQGGVFDAQSLLPGMESDAAMRSAWGIFADLLEFQRGRRLGIIIREFLDTSGYYKQLTAQENHENVEKLQHLSRFSEVVRGFELSSPDGDIGDFVEFAESMEAAGGGSSEGGAAALLGGDAVSILTVHASKGLEFEVVFVPTLVKQRFPSTRRSEGLKVPEVLLQEALPQEDTHVQEERRLFYVACTRAKTRLYLLYSDRYEGAKKWKVSPFVEEVLASGSAEKMMINDDAQVDEKTAVASSSPPKTALEKKLEEVPPTTLRSTSYSRLDTFKTCPLKYKFRYLFQIATPSGHAANFGSSVHATVNEFYEAVKKGEQPSLDLLMRLYEQHWIAAGYESKGHEEKRKKAGQEMMELFYRKEEENGFKVPKFLEQFFRLQLGATLFTGRIDRIDELADGTCEIIDYKTGSSKRDEKLEKDMQLSLYALVGRDVLRLKVSKLSLYFLDDGVKMSTTRTEAQLEGVREELSALVQEVRGSDFQATPGFVCSFCEFKPMCHAAV